MTPSTRAGSERGPRSTPSLRAYVEDYLRSTGATDRYPGLGWWVSTSATVVTVRLSGPLDLPLRVPGVGTSATVSGTASAVVVIGD